MGPRGLCPMDLLFVRAWHSGAGACITLSCQGRSGYPRGRSSCSETPSSKITRAERLLAGNHQIIPNFQRWAGTKGNTLSRITSIALWNSLVDVGPTTPKIELTDSRMESGRMKSGCVLAPHSPQTSSYLRKSALFPTLVTAGTVIIWRPPYRDDRC